MSTAIMTGPAAEASPRFKARLAGVFYLLTFVTGGLALFFGGKFVVMGDAAATAANILAHQSSYGLGFAANLLSSVCYVIVTALFYELFKPVNRSVSRVAAFLSLVGCAIGSVSGAFVLAPLAIVGGAPYLGVFSVEQLQAMSLLFLKLGGQANNVALVLFGCYCLLIGYLVFKSTFLPRTLGVLMAIGGLGWLTFLSPDLSHVLSPYNLAPGIIGEAALTLWLLVMGVNVERWRERASAVAAWQSQRSMPV